MKTLYISDLDGTLLRSDKRLSSFTAETLNRLVGRGMLFSYATSRSYYTASLVTEGFTAQIPTINHNGAFIFENGTGKMLLSNAFSSEDSFRILRLLTEAGIYPIVYARCEAEERFSYAVTRVNDGIRRYLDMHRGDPREKPVNETETLSNGMIIRFLCIDAPDRLEPLYNILKSLHKCIYGREMYSGDYWLEIFPNESTKANAILALKKMVGCDRVVCFGDGKNDLSMFAIADECYAMANAEPELKAIATAVIGHHDDDAVAKWLIATVESQMVAEQGAEDGRS